MGRMHSKGCVPLCRAPSGGPRLKPQLAQLLGRLVLLPCSWPPAPRLTEPPSVCVLEGYLEVGSALPADAAFVAEDWRNPSGLARHCSGGARHRQQDPAYLEEERCVTHPVSCRGRAAAAQSGTAASRGQVSDAPSRAHARLAIPSG
eukprot:scaffold64520_cov55-Phaeocystis_antarctica.AAC.2